MTLVTTVYMLPIAACCCAAHWQRLSEVVSLSASMCAVLVLSHPDDTVLEYSEYGIGAITATVRTTACITAVPRHHDPMKANLPCTLMLHVG